jgi:hypothetical protein
MLAATPARARPRRRRLSSSAQPGHGHLNEESRAIWARVPPAIARAPILQRDGRASGQHVSYGRALDRSRRWRATAGWSSWWGILGWSMGICGRNRGCAQAEPCWSGGRGAVSVSALRRPATSGGCPSCILLPTRQPNGVLEPRKPHGRLWKGFAIWRSAPWMIRRRSRAVRGSRCPRWSCTAAGAGSS